MQKTSIRPTTSRFALGMPAAIIGTAILCVILALAGYTQAVVLGVVQGLGEFLPISSSAHLIIVPWLLGWNGTIVDSVTFDVALHMGTLLALIGFFWRDWLRLVSSAPKVRSRHGSIFWLIVIASIPAGIAGLLLEKYAEHTFRAPLLIAGTLSVMGVILWAVDRWRPQKRTIARVSVRDALLIGVAQAFSIIPGVSRSGSTMTMGRAVGLKRSSAARFSFLMSMPITAAVGLLKLKDLTQISSADLGTFLVGTLVAGLVGALSIGFLMNYLRRASFAVFAVYRVAVAVLIVIVWFARG